MARPAPGAAGGLAGDSYLVADPGDVHDDVLYVSSGTAWKPVRYNRRPVYPVVGNLHWEFTEPNGDLVVVNTGTLVGNDLTVGAPNLLGAPSFWDGEGCLAQIGANAQKAYGALGHVGTSDSTLILWFMPYVLTGWGALVTKAYDPALWNLPFAALSIFMSNAGTGVIEFGVAYGAGLRLMALTPAPFLAQRNELTMLALVWVGATGTIRGYLNGVLAVTATVGGPQVIDYGADGPWGVSGRGIAADANELALGKFLDVWADDTGLSDAQIADIYQRGIGAWGG